MKCGSCDGTGWLYTSSWDDEGFPCPKCSEADKSDELRAEFERLNGEGSSREPL